MFAYEILDKYKNSNRQNFVSYNKVKYLKDVELIRKKHMFSKASKKDLKYISNNQLPKVSSAFTVFEFNNYTPIAFVDVNCIDDNNNFYLVSYVDKKFRGKQISTKLFERIKRRLMYVYNIKHFNLIANINIENEASIKSVERAGFQFKAIDDGELLYVYEQ